MNHLDFFFEDSLAERVLSAAEDGVLSAVRFLTLAENMSEDELDDAYAAMDAHRIMLDISDLPKPAITGEAAARLKLEQQLIEKNQLMDGLDENDPLRLYLQELAMIPACGDPAVLQVDAAAGNENARNLLVNLSLSRVIELAKEHTGKGVLLLDLIQEGSLGLWQSILSWEGTGDFETHRDWWIRAYLARIITLQAQIGGLGQKLRQALEDYRAVDERLLSELGRNPTLEEIALQLHMDQEEVAAVKKMLDDARVLQQAHDDQENKQEDPDDEKHVEDTAYFQMRQRIMELLSGLSEQDAKMLTLRFGLEGGLPLTPADTGRLVGLTAEEVIAREAVALAQLRQG